MRDRTVSTETGKPIGINGTIVRSHPQTGIEEVVGFTDENSNCHYYSNLTQHEIPDVPHPDGGFYAKPDFSENNEPLLRHGLVPVKN